MRPFKPRRLSWHREAGVTWPPGFVGTSLLARTGHGTCHRAMSCTVADQLAQRGKPGPAERHSGIAHLEEHVRMTWDPESAPAGQVPARQLRAGRLRRVWAGRPPHAAGGAGPPPGGSREWGIGGLLGG